MNKPPQPDQDPNKKGEDENEAREKREAERFAELESFRREHGHVNVPAAHPGGLGNWVAAQRRAAKQPDYPETRRARLDALGFAWVRHDSAWEQRFSELESFHREHGHAKVPAAYPGGLGNWLKARKAEARSGAMPAALAQQIEAAGASLEPTNKTFEERMQELVAFRRKHGHADVARHAFDLEAAHAAVEGAENQTDQGDAASLARWIAKQRVAHNQGRLDAARAQQLAELGVALGGAHPNEVRFRERMADLVKFRRQHGHGNVPAAHPGGLGLWVSAQRRAAKRPGYPEERRAGLDSVGFEWSPRESNEVMRIGELEAFKKEHGHTDVPQNHPGGLGLWVRNQRAREDSETPARRARLDALGFKWSVNQEDRADGRLRELEEFKREKGHIEVPFRHPGGLGAWLSKQRRAALLPSYPDERRRRLDALGFVWRNDDDDDVDGSD